MNLENILTELPLDFPGMNSVPTDAVYLMGCGNFEQYCCTLRSIINPRVFCPFCSQELKRRNRTPARQFDNWMLLSNEFPHKTTKQMWLIVPERHVVSRTELTSTDWATIGLLLNVCGIESGGVMFRFGDPRLNAGTITHLHINVIEPICGSEFRPPFAKDISKHMTDYTRMIGFQQKLAERGGIVWLLSNEGIKETQPEMV